MISSSKNIYADIIPYSKEIGVSPEVLIEAFDIESHYNRLLVNEVDAAKREKLYREFYSRLLQFYGRIANDEGSMESNIATKDNQVSLFEKELKNKSIIDFGCGEGLFLFNILKKIPYKNLVGVDIFIPESLKQQSAIRFIESSIITFQTEDKFDIAFSDNVIEHLSPLDLIDHVHSVYDSLHPGGKFIIIMPNRLFGPMDITRIIDNSSSGKTTAQGGHLNESTYTDMIHALTQIGFMNFQTVMPIPIFKYSIFKNIRIRTGWIKGIEQNKFLLSLFRSIKIKGRCPIRFSITLICQKPLT
ncbi:MAG: class I SAM-dependent methyltransferase [bacterium]|jgi:SAM-dependent methyltransferase